MESVNPPLLDAVQEIRWQISNGRSMKESFQEYLSSNNDELAAEFRELWTLKWKSKSEIRSTVVFKTHFRRAFWDLVERGCAGQPVLEPLCGLENEIALAAQAELDRHISTLPFKVLLPLLLFQFPAHMILLLGPMLRDLNRTLGGGA